MRKGDHHEENHIWRARLYLWTGHADAILLWDLRTGTRLARLYAHGERIHGLAYSADDRLFASGGADGVIRLWDAEQRTLLRHVCDRECATA
jgi:WD40 repeat protein